jgi:subtilisin family serine protease
VTGSNSIYVGIIDEGVQWQHPELVANVWSNSFEAPDGLDNDGNGYADDSHGWNFAVDNNQLYTAGQDNHGTHVAGTIGATGGNGKGVAGVNWNVTFIPTKFLSVDGGYTSDAVQAIDYLTDLKTRHGLNIVAINNSWGGGGYSRALQDAILRAAKANILFVVAAGNGDTNNIGINNDVIADYPANYDTTVKTRTESAASYNAVVSVAAIDRYGALATFSNYGLKTVHIGAPGVSILSTVPENSYAWSSGTSMAAPHVTGAIALYASTHPGETASQIRSAILNAAAPTVSLTGKTGTGGRLNIGTVALGLAGKTAVATPAQLKSQLIENQFRLSLTGGTNQVYEIQVSPDLTNWTRLLTVTNTSGTLQINDSINGGGWPQKFYRALAK